MNSLNKTTNGIAGLVAILATVIICGGTLSLADHYTRQATGGYQLVTTSPALASAALRHAS